MAVTSEADRDWELGVSFANAGDPGASSKLQVWLAETQLTAPEDVLLRLSDFRLLHVALEAVFTAIVSGEREPAEAVTRLNEASAAVPMWPILTEDRDRSARRLEAVSASPTAKVLAEIARSAIALAGGPHRDALRRCPAPRCGRFFVATRPRQTWCSDRCGNRVRVARHHERRRSAAERRGTRA